MHYKRSGNSANPTVVFLHALATDGTMWDRVIDSLKDEYDCIAIDLPGHGLSSEIPWTSLTDFALKLQRFITEESSNGKAHIVGLSFGAYAGLVLANNYPHCVESAFLSGINIMPLRNKFVMKVLSWFISKVIKADFIIRMNARMLKIKAEDLPAYRQSIATLNTKSYYQANLEAIDFNMPKADSIGHQRMLFVAGQLEHPLVLTSLKMLCQEFSNAEAYVVTGLGHGWSAENPGLFSQAVRKWIHAEVLPSELLPF